MAQGKDTCFHQLSSDTVMLILSAYAYAIHVKGVWLCYSIFIGERWNIHYSTFHKVFVLVQTYFMVCVCVCVCFPVFYGIKLSLQGVTAVEFQLKVQT